jgi:plasmid stabilization system protein ParE
MTAVIVSPEAERDLEDLTDRIANAAGQRVAVAYVDRIFSVAERWRPFRKLQGDPYYARHRFTVPPIRQLLSLSGL